MRFRIINFLLVFLLVMGGLLVSVSSSVGAQTASSTPTPTTLATATTPVPGPNPDAIYLYQLEQTDIQLAGPYDVAALVFDLPADWKLTQAATLDLNLTVSLSVFAPEQAASQISGGGGNLTVEFNREVVGSFPLTQNGNTVVQLSIPLDVLDPVRSDGRQELVFVLDSGESCLINQQMTVIVHNSSVLTFPHEVVLPDISLARFPFPIYQAALFPDSALIVVPDEPTAAELQSAMVVAAGLGRLSGLNLALDLTSQSKLTPDQLKNEHIVLVGKANTLTLLNQLALPLASRAGKFQSPQGNDDDGIIQMVHSPWNEGRVVLVVSGNTDPAVVKSAQALSTGVLRPNTSPNVAIIQDVQGGFVSPPVANEVTLLDLGYSNTLLERRGVDTVSFRFFVPPDQILGPDAYFELVYGNSALLNYGRSGLVVQVNNQPIGSVRFSDVTANLAMNRLQISIPSSVIVSGSNKLDIISSLQPIDTCSLPNMRGLWANIWSDSRLHLPFIPAPVRTTPIYDLSTFPAPLTFDSTLATTALVLQPNDLESWRSALQVAAYLGDRSNGSISLLQTYYADALPESARSNLNLVVIGMVPELTILSELNEHLPAPFESASGIATERNMQVTYRIPADSPIGYVELFPSPWNSRNVVIAALGNLRQGAKWGVSALYEASLRSQLTGNFAAINDQQVITTDTRLVPGEVTSSPTSQPGELAAPTSVVTILRPDAVNRPAWILPALTMTLGLIVVILLGVLYNSIVQNRRRKVHGSSQVSKARTPDKEDQDNH